MDETEAPHFNWYKLVREDNVTTCPSNVEAQKVKTQFEHTTEWLLETESGGQERGVQMSGTKSVKEKSS